MQSSQRGRSPVPFVRCCGLITVPVALGASIINLAAHGSHVWLLGTVGSERATQHDTLAGYRSCQTPSSS